jgi:hypothetical protein
MREDTHNLQIQINFSKTPVAGNIAGAIVALGSIAICLVGLPALRNTFLAAIAFGCGIALILRFIRPKPLGRSWIPSATKK